MVDSIPRSFKPWIIASVVVLVGSLLLLAVVVTMGMIELRNPVTPLWVILAAVLAALGIFAGFGGFFGLMLFAGWQTWREARRVQVLPPEPPPPV